MAPLYELIVLTKAAPADAAPQLKKLLKTCATHVWDKGGVLADIRPWGQRELAYRIRKQAVNYYQAQSTSLHIYVSPSTMTGLERTLLNSDHVLRHMVIKQENMPKLDRATQDFGKFPFARPEPPLETVDLEGDPSERMRWEYRNLVMQRVFEGRTEQEMLAEQMTQARFTPQQAWFQEPAHRKDARLYELLKQPPPALPSRAADGELSGAIEAPDGGAAAAPPSDAAGGGPPKDPER